MTPLWISNIAFSVFTPPSNWSAYLVTQFLATIYHFSFAFIHVYRVPQLPPLLFLIAAILALISQKLVLGILFSNFTHSHRPFLPDSLNLFNLAAFSMASIQGVLTLFRIADLCFPAIMFLTTCCPTLEDRFLTKLDCNINHHILCIISHMSRKVWSIRSTLSLNEVQRPVIDR
uniref:Uncharacterized protein n=1 Tax=Funneliformis mosseae TaxID=27381 RepID=A0A1D6YDA8_FUNMO|nr:hypothetical protein [Funneliformis mosseae]